MTYMTIINRVMHRTNNFGHIPDAPEPDETECMEDCESCVWFGKRSDGANECNDRHGEGYKEKK